ncbi:hypothetical protein FSP39_005818 [Pinctada imbricata]|uniref:Uncharacterized protein n=1 Tax=Pinctada imbricata TaxID=66713 RepID=A0AA88YCL6_PINIB|nr:hypothetical protein FSP39_005818 [Pinctada imbricata]
MSNDVREILKGFKVPQETLWELKQYFDRRPKSKISETLSKEAKLAIQQTKDEFLIKREDFIYKTDHGVNRHGRADGQRKSDRKVKCQNTEKMTKKTSFSETYDGSSSVRMDGDVVNGNSDTVVSNEHTKNDNLETTLTKGTYKKEQKDNDDLAISETAKQNAVEKCMVWMTVNEEDTHRDRSTVTQSATSTDSTLL